MFTLSTLKKVMKNSLVYACFTFRGEGGAKCKSLTNPLQRYSYDQFMKHTSGS